MCSICNFLDYNEEIKSKEILRNLNIHFIETIFHILNSIISRKDLLKKIMKEAYNQLHTQKATISLSVERLFTLAFFVFFDCSLDDLEAMNFEDIMELMGEK